MSAQMIVNHMFAKVFPDAVRIHFHSRSEFLGTLVEGIVVFSQDGRFLSANRSAQFQLGQSVNSLRAHTFSSLFGQAISQFFDRLCGDWMKGTEATPARQPLQTGVFDWGGHRLELKRLSGHTDDDLVLIDHSTGVVFAGGLVFADRVPTTPHARLADWRASLNSLRQIATGLPLQVLVPSHGPVHSDLRGLEQTRDWLDWLEQTLSRSARDGLDLGEVLRQPIPERFARWAAMPAEFVRSVTYLYPQHELAALRAGPTSPVTGQ
jgi:glyoxylase-like metal-dependent hydrolase (beta-lactamase superfamily II)